MRLAGLLPLALVLLSADALAESHVIETRHYRLHYEGARAQADEAARVLEAAWPGFARHFGAEPALKPGERLTVRFLKTRAGWEAAIRADGTRPPGTAGGYYWPGSKTAYLFRQPTVFFTRTLLIHEAAHQFHYLARTNNKSPAAGWYTEGVAEYLGWHRWDGEKLELGVVPGVTLKDYPAVALEEVTRDGFALSAIVEGTSRASRPVGWALYRFLATSKDGEPIDGFEGFVGKMDALCESRAAFEECVGDPLEVQPRFIDWLRTQQAAWAPVWNEWEQIGEARMRGYAGVVSACRVKSRTRSMAATLEVPKKGWWRAGLLLHFKDVRNYTVGLLDSTGALRVHARVRDKWKRLLDAPFTGKMGAEVHRFAAVREAGRVTWKIDGHTIGSWPLPGATFGLALERGDVRFRDVAWR